MKKTEHKNTIQDIINKTKENNFDYFTYKLTYKLKDEKTKHKYYFVQITSKKNNKFVILSVVILNFDKKILKIIDHDFINLKTFLKCENILEVRCNFMS